jgi:hypothetical protein
LLGFDADADAVPAGADLFGAPQNPRQIFHAASGRAATDLPFCKICSGSILEIGAFVGGAAIAAAFGVRDSGRQKKLIAIEPGGSVKHKRLGTRNILRDLERNLARQRVSEMVTLLKAVLLSRQ